MEIKEKIEALRKQISYHSDRYYNQDNPEISDYEFDMMMNELKQEEARNGPPVLWCVTMFRC